MIKKIFKKIKNKLFPELIQINSSFNELLWAEKFRNSVQNKSWLNTISLNPNGMAANYSFLYILGRILDEFEPKNILEFGLGETSKFINCYMNHSLKYTHHDIIEDNLLWVEQYKFEKNERCKIHVKDLTNIRVRDLGNIQIFKNLEDVLKPNYDLYIIDGPRGVKNYSRYDICLLAENLFEKSEFIIIFDDAGRKGEQETLEELYKTLTKKNITYHTNVITGTKNQEIIVTDRYKFALSF